MPAATPRWSHPRLNEPWIPLSLRRGVRRNLVRHRRVLLALGVVLLAVSIARIVAPAPPATTTAWVASRDLPAGSLIAPADFIRTQVVDAPDGVVAARAGLVLAGPVRRGEVLTDAGVRGGVEPPAGTQALPVRFPDAQMAALLTPGDVIDLVATDPESGSAYTVADGVLVLAGVARGDDEGFDPGQSGALVIVAATTDLVGPITDASRRLFLGFAWSDDR